MSNCEFLGCSLKGSASVVDHAGRAWVLCRRHAEIVARAVEGRFIVDLVERPGKDPRVEVRQPARYSGPDWEAHYQLLERPGHAIMANGASFATDLTAPANVLICACGWRGHYRMWPQHLRAGAPPIMRGGSDQSGAVYWEVSDTPERPEIEGTSRPVKHPVGWSIERLLT